MKGTKRDIEKKTQLKKYRERKKLLGRKGERVIKKERD